MAIDPNLISPDEFMDSSDDEPEEEEEEEIDEVGRPLDVAEDGKVVKTITSLGTGRLKPGPGAVVSLYYTATLDDGTPVATHARPKAPFQFTLGAGEVSKGWDCGVATMKKGEQATLRCAPEYAGGPPAAAGPDAAVRFDVELVSWVEWKDVSELQDGTIMKTIVTEGGGARTPDFDAVVTVSWRLTLEDPTGDATPEALEEKEGVVFTVGAEEVAPKGLEKAVQTMLDGEEAVVRLGPAEGYGAGGDARLRVPPDAPVYYALAVRDVRLAPQVWDLDTHEAKLQRAALLKDEGNALFKGGKTSRAVKKYQAAMSFVETEYELTEAEKVWGVHSAMRTEWPQSGLYTPTRYSAHGPFYTRHTRVHLVHIVHDACSARTR